MFTAGFRSSGPYYIRSDRIPRQSRACGAKHSRAIGVRPRADDRSPAAVRLRRHYHTHTRNSSRGTAPAITVARRPLGAVAAIFFTRDPGTCRQAAMGIPPAGNTINRKIPWPRPKTRSPRRRRLPSKRRSRNARPSGIRRRAAPEPVPRRPSCPGCRRSSHVGHNPRGIWPTSFSTAVEGSDRPGKTRGRFRAAAPVLPAACFRLPAPPAWEQAVPPVSRRRRRRWPISDRHRARDGSVKPR